MSKKILVRGPLLSESGYGNHARQVFRWLLSRHQDAEISVQILPWGSTSWYVNPAAEGGLVGEIMKRSVEPNQKFDVSFQIQLPNEWSADLAHKNIGVTAVVESDKCNPEWIKCCNAMTAVVVPSSFCEKTLRSTGEVTSPIIVIPESFIPEVMDKNAEINIDFETKFNFLLVGTITGNNPFNDRKNLFFALKWLCEEFSNDPDVGIILKASVGRGTKLDWGGVESSFRNAINQVRRGPFPKVHIVHGITSNSEIAALYRHPTVKALVAPTRGEGFGLPILEAAASGLPVIATEHSGHMDFMGKGKFVRLEYDMSPIHQTRVDNNIWMAGTKWAEVRESDFKKKVRKFKSSPDNPKQWALDLSKILIDTHNPGAIDEFYEISIGEILK
jgi:glycosyltransferase involved in cell wall biosynthesis